MPSRACSAGDGDRVRHTAARRVYGSSWKASVRRRLPAEDLPKPYTSAVSTSPVWILHQASYSAQAASASTCDSLIGGTGPIASMAEMNENARPAR